MCPTLNELKQDKFARIVEIKVHGNLKEKLAIKGISEGDILRIVSCYGSISFEIDGRTFVICRVLAEKIRIIEINFN